MKIKNLAAAAAILLLAAALPSGCAAAGRSDPPDADAAETSGLFTERDLAQTAELSEAKTVALSDGETLTIREGGVYLLSGSVKEAQVVVEAGDKDKVQLVLNGLSIVNSDRACILAEKADKVFITSAEGSENSLTVGGSFGGKEDAVIWARDELVLNGLGAVMIRSAGDGVRAGDELKLTGGSWQVTAEDCALTAHDGILIHDGRYALEAGNDGLHAEDDDDTVGSIVILGGSLTIRAGDDGIHATTVFTVNGGTLTISAAEGVEATQVIVNGGEISIEATDDGVNAGRKSKSMNVKIEVKGGRLTVVMGPGDTDGLDSNGDLIISGGVVDVTAKNPFDCDGNCSYTGGTVVVNGTEVDRITPG